MADLEMRETGDGGDLILKGNDLSVIEGFQNMPYLASFGGNVAASTEGAKVPDEQAFDWWGNHLLLTDDKTIQYNSDFERRLTEVALSSSGRIQLEQAILSDLDFMKAFSIISASVSIESVDRIKISIQIQEPDNLGSNAFVYIWDGTKLELEDS